MQTVYKYELDEIVSLPLRANIIRVDYDYNLKPCLWAIVDTDRPHEDRYFEMFATGQAMRRLDSDHFRTYVGTIHDVNDCMWHVFEVKAKRSDAGVHTYIDTEISNVIVQLVKSICRYKDIPAIYRIDANEGCDVCQVYAAMWGEGAPKNKKR